MQAAATIQKASGKFQPWLEWMATIYGKRTLWLIYIVIKASFLPGFPACNLCEGAALALLQNTDLLI